MKTNLKYFGIGILIIITSPIWAGLFLISVPFGIIYFIGRSFYENYWIEENEIISPIQ